jgi:glycosyltransferase involved in cell wall biosynthesis
MNLPVCIVIPTHNRRHCISQAIEGALGQSHPDVRVIVVDDASTDGSWEIIADHARRSVRCAAVRLERNLGTAGAKNVGLLLAGTRAVTFHDSDDLPHRDKVLRQARVMAQPRITADPCLNWALVGHRPGLPLQIGAVFTHHEILLPNGRRVEIGRTLSLVDDIFPNLQMGSTVAGDWTHVNSGLFHPDLLTRLGGFSDCIEEDREFRNRLILSGEVAWIVPEILLTKIESIDSLTQSAATDYESAHRRKDRARVWAMVEAWRDGRPVAPCPIDLPDLDFAATANAALLSPSKARATEATKARLQHLLDAPDERQEVAS